MLCSLTTSYVVRNAIFFNVKVLFCGNAILLHGKVLFLKMFAVDLNCFLLP